MTSLNLSPTSSTPSIDFNAETGELRITGVSTLLDPRDFYIPVLAWTDKYVAMQLPHTQVFINCMYLNTMSSKYVLDLLQKMKLLTDAGNKVTITWEYDEGDDDIMIAGEQLSHISGLPFTFTANKREED